MNQLLFVDGTVLMADLEEKLCNLMEELDECVRGI